MSDQAAGRSHADRAAAKIQITKTKLLLVEGVDEERFFASAMKRHLNIPGVQVLGIAGKTTLRENLAGLLRDPDFGQLTCLAIVRDADSSAQSAFHSLCDSLRHHRLPVPNKHGEFTEGSPRVGVFIMPDGESDGMLETLCVEAVQTNPEATCVEAYMKCLKEKGMTPTPIDKARAHAWLASRSKPDKRVGEAAQAGYWPFAHSAFGDLWNFIRAM